MRAVSLVSFDPLMGHFGGLTTLPHLVLVLPVGMLVALDVVVDVQVLRARGSVYCFFLLASGEG
jgi:hypothetical protein